MSLKKPGYMDWAPNLISFLKVNDNQLPDDAYDVIKGKPKLGQPNATRDSFFLGGVLDFSLLFGPYPVPCFPKAPLTDLQIRIVLVEDCAGAATVTYALHLGL